MAEPRRGYTADKPHFLHVPSSCPICFPCMYPLLGSGGQVTSGQLLGLYTAG